MKINWTVLMILLLIVCLIGISLIFRVVRILNTEVEGPVFAATSDMDRPTAAESQIETQQLMAKQKNRLKVIQLQERANDQGEPARQLKNDTRYNTPLRRIHLLQGGSRTQ